MNKGVLDRMAGAPITWGVDGSPGWGHLMDRDRVMSEMVTSGLVATELGPDGYLPTDPDELSDFVGGFGLQVVGGFVPALLYRQDKVEGELAYVRRAARQLAVTGAKMLIVGPSSHFDGYDTSVEMRDEEWDLFLVNLAHLEEIVANEGLTTALHPHWGMAIEKRHHIDRLLESSGVGLCLDTGHLYLGGTDPVDLAKIAGDRVRHVHLKDVDPVAAERVRSGQTLFRDSVSDGMFVPLGSGAVDIAGTIESLEASGFEGWYVLEQDTALAAEPAPGAGPLADALASLAYLRSLVDD